jgi:hypothetical protein
MWARHVAHIEESRGTYRLLVFRSQGKPRRRRESNIKMILVK